MTPERARQLAAEIAGLFGGNGLTQNQQILLVAAKLEPLEEGGAIYCKTITSSNDQIYNRIFPSDPYERQ